MNANASMKPLRTILAVVATLAGAAIARETISAAAAAEPVNVFTSGQDGYHTYRIPATVATRDGELLAFCEGRKSSRADHGDIDLLVKRSADGGRTWSEQAIVYEEGGDQNVTIGNPCPVVDQDTGTIWLPFCRDNDDVLITSSNDGGKTWAPPREITADVKKSNWSWYATGPGVGIQLTRGPHRGRLVIPCDHRESSSDTEFKVSHVFYSDDHGQSWQLGGSVAPHTDECQVAELPDGRLLINMRNYWQREGRVAELGGKRAVSVSADGAESWGGLTFDEALLEPVCQAGLIRYSWPEEGRSRLVFSNPASSTARERMTLRISYDEGRTWPVAKLVDPGSAAYSCPVRLPDGQIGLLYERDGYRQISFVALPLADVAGDEP